MEYLVKYNQLDKNKKVLKEHSYICFSPLNNKNNFLKETQYLEFNFDNTRSSVEQMTKYFLFLKTIPIFASFMPRSCVKLAKEQKYIIDITKVNATKVLTMFSLIRTVIESPNLVKEINKFKRNYKYSISNLCILKAVGSVYCETYGHWINLSVHKNNINKEYNIKDSYWNEQRPLKESTGFSIHSVFKFPADSVLGRNYKDFVTKDIIKNLQQEYKPQKRNIKLVNILNKGNIYETILV